MHKRSRLISLISIQHTIHFVLVATLCFPSATHWANTDSGENCLEVSDIIRGASTVWCGRQEGKREKK